MPMGHVRSGLIYRFGGMALRNTSSRGPRELGCCLFESRISTSKEFIDVKGILASLQSADGCHRAGTDNEKTAQPSNSLACAMQNVGSSESMPLSSGIRICWCISPSFNLIDGMNSTLKSSKTGTIPVPNLQ